MTRLGLNPCDPLQHQHPFTVQKSAQRTLQSSSAPTPPGDMTWADVHA